MSKSHNERLAVCSWSLQPGTPQDLVAALNQIGLQRIQLALDPLRESPAVWGKAPEVLRASQVTTVSGMFGTVGEDYTTLESIRRTGGLVPDATWPQNWQNIQATARLAKQLGLGLVSFHAGFLPHEESDPDFGKLRDRIRKVAEQFAKEGVNLAFETGQETAETLRAFLEKLGCPNVGVNFDPANMILYDKGNPIEAVRVLGPWIRQCHIKDARKTRQPGTWGEEVPAGTGEVDWRAFFAALKDAGFTGDLCIEREAGNQRAQDILTARKFIETLG